MDEIDRLLDVACNDVIEHLGRTVFVNGIPLKCTIDDEQFEDESGYRREVLFSFNKSDAPLLSKGASVVYKDNTFVIGRLPREDFDDPFYTVELKRA